MSVNRNDLNAMFVNCTLKKSPQKSHTETLMRVAQRIMQKEGVALDELRLVDHDVPDGVYPDMTEHGWEEDEWPDLFERIISADILVIGTPIWLGQISSIAKKLIERLYAMSSKTNKKGQYIFYGKVGGCMITGNEDGVKHCGMEILYSLQHIGYTLPPQVDCGWIGEIGPGPSYGDTEWQGEEIEPPMGFDHEFTNKNLVFMTYNLLQMAALLKNVGGFSSYGNSNSKWEEGIQWGFEKPHNF